MPLELYASLFTPEEFEILKAAFDAAWGEIRASGCRLSTGEEALLLQQELAEAILVSAMAAGVRDVDMLKEDALWVCGVVA